MIRWKERSNPVPYFLPSFPTRDSTLLSSLKVVVGTKEEKEERNTEKNKASKGTFIPIHPYPNSSSSLAHLTSPSDLTSSIDFVSVFACRQLAGDQQEGHEHPGAYLVVTAARALPISLSFSLISLFFLLSFQIR